MQRFIYSALVLALLMTGCSQSTAPAADSDPTDLRGPVWILEAIDGQAVTQISMPRTHLRFTDDRQYQGIGPCNIYGGEYTAQVGILHVDDAMFQTKKLGYQPDVELEIRYFEALKQATRFEVESDMASSDVLRIYYGAGGILRFTAE